MSTDWNKPRRQDDKKQPCSSLITGNNSQDDRKWQLCKNHKVSANLYLDFNRPTKMRRVPLHCFTQFWVDGLALHHPGEKGPLNPNSEPIINLWNSISAGFLLLSIIDIWGWNFLSFGSCLLHCWIFRIVPVSKMSIETF